MKGARRLRCVPGGRLSPLRLLVLLPSLLDTDMLVTAVGPGLWVTACRCLA